MQSKHNILHALINTKKILKDFQRVKLCNLKKKNYTMQCSKYKHHFQFVWNPLHQINNSDMESLRIKALMNESKVKMLTSQWGMCKYTLACINEVVVGYEGVVKR